MGVNVNPDPGGNKRQGEQQNREQRNQDSSSVSRDIEASLPKAPGSKQSDSKKTDTSELTLPSARPSKDTPVQQVLNKAEEIVKKTQADLKSQGADTSECTATLEVLGSEAGPEIKKALICGKLGLSPNSDLSVVEGKLSELSNSLKENAISNESVREKGADITQDTSVSESKEESKLVERLRAINKPFRWLGEEAANETIAFTTQTAVSGMAGALVGGSIALTTGSSALLPPLLIGGLGFPLANAVVQEGLRRVGFNRDGK